MTILPADDTLTQQGFAEGASEASILLIACGALAHEILALTRANGWTHMTLTCLPAKYHLYPDKITEAVEEAVAKHRGDYDEIFVVYADCGTGGQLQAKCEELGVKMVEGPHCYSFFEGNDTFSERSENGEITAFYLTDFLVKQFDAFIWKPMGLDRHPELRDMIFGNYTKLVYQAQIKNPALVEKAKACAERLGLDFEYRFTGYGDLETTLRDVSKKG
ncbi:DUF1638 domain-containing protein [uncultured Roseovarius sp.]|uniref:DUF1638 domain-containing protein n=1 Tax=uncultured Roseovarius sp. TaxID=293344 RepID=UPI00260ABB5D|nr:DUF1638 domain-containing protein [uncultured Roseovarius sp.]